MSDLNNTVYVSVISQQIGTNYTGMTFSPSLVSNNTFSVGQIYKFYCYKRSTQYIDVPTTYKGIRFYYYLTEEDWDEGNNKHVIALSRNQSSPTLLPTEFFDAGFEEDNTAPAADGSTSFYYASFGSVNYPLTVDLSNFSAYGTLTAGTHELTIVAKASGYYDSIPSEALEFSRVTVETPSNVMMDTSGRGAKVLSISPSSNAEYYEIYVDNSLFYTWTPSGTGLQSSITDLANTGWRVSQRPGIPVSNDYYVFNYGGDTLQTGMYTQINFYRSSRSGKYVTVSDSIVWSGHSYVYDADYNGYYGTYSNETYTWYSGGDIRTLFIGSGQDTTNSDLISWCTRYCTQLPRYSIDLSTLNGWSELGEGDHTVKIRGCANGFIDSPFSPSQEFTINVQSPDLIINSTYTDEDITIYYTLINGTSASEQITAYESYEGTIISDVATVDNIVFGSDPYDGYYGGYSINEVSFAPLPYNLNGEATEIDVWFSWCLSGDTLVTMKDGFLKRLDQIDLGDEIISYDWNTKTKILRKVIYTDKDIPKFAREFDIWTFSDGTNVTTAYRHRFYNYEAKKFKYLDEWQFGEHTINSEGKLVALESRQHINGDIRHYKITLEGDTNYFANGLLTGDRYCPESINLGEE